MSIKGIRGSKLFIGKTEVNIFDSRHVKSTMSYSDMLEIQYYPSEQSKTGYMSFLSESDTLIFRYKEASNPGIKRAIAYILNAKPELKIEQKPESPNAKDNRISAKKLFIGLICLSFLIVFVGGFYRLFRTSVNVSVPSTDDDYLEPIDNYVSAEKTSAVYAESETIAKELLTDSFSTTLVSGHYIVGIDIPAGTYTLSSRKGKGNVITDDGSVNTILNADASSDDISSFEISQLDNVYLGQDVTLFVLGNQEVSAGCSDGQVYNMSAREQSENLEEIECGYGWFSSGADFIPGTYDITWIEGNGNIISEFEPEGVPGINEIMGDYSDSYVKEFRHLYMPEGFTLKIDDIKIKLSPSK